MAFESIICNAQSAEAERKQRRREYERNWAKLNKDKVIAKTLKWRKANPEKWRESNRRSKLANQKKYTDRQRCDYALNPEKYRVVERRRRAKMKGVGGAHTQGDLADIFYMQGGLCAYCRKGLDLAEKHVDHILPIALGGSNDRSNLQYLCASCNRTKGAKHPLSFAREIGLLL